MEVQLENFKRQSKSDRHGWRVDFKIKNKDKGKIKIYQNINMTIEIKNENGEKEKINGKYVEAWNYSKKVLTDSFLIPIEWRKNTEGFIYIESVIWAQKGDYNKSLKIGTTSNKWGLLYGKNGQLNPPSNVIKTRRKFKATWNNIGKTNRKTFTEGKDLQLIENEII